MKYKLTIFGMLAIFAVANMSFTSSTVVTNNYIDTVTRECGQGFTFNLGFVRHVPRRIIERVFYDPFTGLETGRTTFKEDCTDDGAWIFPWE